MIWFGRYAVDGTQLGRPEVRDLCLKWFGEFADIVKCDECCEKWDRVLGVEAEQIAEPLTKQLIASQEHMGACGYIKTVISGRMAGSDRFL